MRKLSDMATLIEYFYKKSQAIKEPKPSTDTTSGTETVKQTMATDFKEVAQWISRVYVEFPEKKKEAAMKYFAPLEERINEQYRDENWPGFQETLTEIYRIFRNLSSPDKRSCRKNGHWIYRAWSRVLDAEVWFVCCQQEVTELIQKGVKRGAIYTENELKELISLPKTPPESLKKIHLVKSYFDGVIHSYR